MAAAVCGALAAGAVARLVVRPRPALSRRVRPYVVISRSRLGLPPDRVLGREFGERARNRMLSVLAQLDGSSDEKLETLLVHAGVQRGTEPVERVLRYRVRRLLAASAGCLAGLLIGVVAGRGVFPSLVAGAIGTAGALAYSRGRLQRRIEDRRGRLQVELHTIELVLAIRLRVGESVAAAVRQVALRTRGEVATDLSEALRLHRSGLGMADALRHVASMSPEPHAIRCYHLVAAGHERGGDVAGGLLALSVDLRDDRREALRRAATKRRALMLVPTVAILAPVLLIFVGAPLPWIVFRGFG